MDIENIIEDVKKYHYIGCGDKKCKIMGSSNDKKEAKETTMQFLLPEWDDFIGAVIYLVSIRMERMIMVN